MTFKMSRRWFEPEREEAPVSTASGLGLRPRQPEPAGVDPTRSGIGPVDDAVILGLEARLQGARSDFKPRRTNACE